MLGSTFFTLLIFHSGNDKLIPDGKKHGDYFMDWAVGEKEFGFYPDGEHVCANYLDEVIPYSIDWLSKHLCQCHMDPPIPPVPEGKAQISLGWVSR